MGEHHPNYLTLLRNLADTYAKIFNNKQALTLLSNCLTTYNLLYGPGHPDYYNTLNHMANIFECMGNLVFAMKLMRLLK